MGTIIGRSRKDGSKAFTAQIVIKKDGVVNAGAKMYRLAGAKIHQ